MLNRVNAANSGNGNNPTLNYIKNQYITLLMQPNVEDFNATKMGINRMMMDLLDRYSDPSDHSNGLYIAIN